MNSNFHTWLTMQRQSSRPSETSLPVNETVSQQIIKYGSLQSSKYFAYILIYLEYVTLCSAWGSVVVKALCCATSRKVPGSIPGRVTGEFFRNIPQVHVPGVKNEYQDIPGGKGGRCVEVTTLPPSCAKCQEIWEL